MGRVEKVPNTPGPFFCRAATTRGPFALVELISRSIQAKTAYAALSGSSIGDQRLPVLPLSGHSHCLFGEPQCRGRQRRCSWLAGACRVGHHGREHDGGDRSDRCRQRRTQPLPAD